MEIISSFDTLTLGKYEEIQGIARREDLDEIDRHILILSVLTGASEEDLLHLPIAEFTDLSARAKFLDATDFKPGRIARKYQVGSWELYPVTDYRRLETCQYLDFQTFSKDVDHNLVELLSVILVPRGHRYNEGYDILEVQQALRDSMSVTMGVTVVGFFLTLFSRLIEDSLHYSRKMAKGIKDKEKREEMMRRISEQEKILSSANGDGSQM